MLMSKKTIDLIIQIKKSVFFFHQNGILFFKFYMKNDSNVRIYTKSG